MKLLRQLVTAARVLRNADTGGPPDGFSEPLGPGQSHFSQALGPQCDVGDQRGEVEKVAGEDVGVALGPRPSPSPGKVPRVRRIGPTLPLAEAGCIGSCGRCAAAVRCGSRPGLLAPRGVLVVRLPARTPSPPGVMKHRALGPPPAPSRTRGRFPPDPFPFTCMKPTRWGLPVLPQPPPLSGSHGLSLMRYRPPRAVTFPGGLPVQAPAQRVDQVRADVSQLAARVINRNSGKVVSCGGILYGFSGRDQPAVPLLFIGRLLVGWVADAPPAIS